MKKTELSKDELEQKKLELEIKELKRHWLKNPKYLGILLTIILAIISLAWTLTSGVFDKKYQTLKLEKASLQFEINNFNIKRDSVKKEFNILNDSLRKLKYALKRKEYDLFQRIYELGKLKSENNEYLEQIEFYKEQLHFFSNFNKQIGITDEALEGKYEDDYESAVGLLSEDGKFILTKDSSVIKVNEQ